MSEPLGSKISGAKARGVTQGANRDGKIPMREITNNQRANEIICCCQRRPSLRQHPL